MREERGERKHVIPPSLIRRGMESLTVYSECRDAIHRMINHPLWNDVGVTPVLLLDIFLLFPLSTFISHPEFPNLGRNIVGVRAEEEISVKKRRLFDCFKNAEGIRFRKFTAQIPIMIHRAVLAPPFWRQKVAETNV